MMEMPNKTMSYLRMYYDSFPILLNINHSFSYFELFREKVRKEVEEV